jgi:hypothetical protein
MHPNHEDLGAVADHIGVVVDIRRRLADLRGRTADLERALQVAESEAVGLINSALKTDLSIVAHGFAWWVNFVNGPALRSVPCAYIAVEPSAREGGRS